MKKLRKLETSYRVMKVLKMLHSKPMGFDELCYGLDIDEIGVNRETITKYFSTLREVGCVIEKSGGKFRLKHMPLFVNFTQKELETLAIFQKFTQKLYQKRINDKIQSALVKILRMTDIELHKRYHRILNSVKFDDSYCKNKEKLELFSNFFDENSRKLKIKYHGEYLKISPKSFKFYENSVHLFAFNDANKKYESYLLDDIEEIMSLIQSFNVQDFASPTVFKITDRLAGGYYPYEGEVVTTIGKDDKNVLNKTQNKTELHSRLLKYGEFCTLISPQDEVQEFVEEIDEMIKNYSSVS